MKFESRTGEVEGKSQETWTGRGCAAFATVPGHAAQVPMCLTH